MTTTALGITAFALGALIGITSGVGSAAAQEGLATSGGVRGQNTIQQAPSGSRVGGGAPAAGGTAARGEPTAEERQTEKHNNDVTQICKGC